MPLTLDRPQIANMRKEGARTRQPSHETDCYIRDLTAIPIVQSVSNIGGKVSQCAGTQTRLALFFSISQFGIRR